MLGEGLLKSISPTYPLSFRLVIGLLDGDCLESKVGWDWLEGWMVRRKEDWQAGGLVAWLDGWIGRGKAGSTGRYWLWRGNVYGA